MSSTERTSLLLSILLVLGACWAPVADLGYVWDDDDYVVANPHLEDLDGLRTVWTWPFRGLLGGDRPSAFAPPTPQYYPMVFTSYALERALFDAGPRGHHLTNAALHLASALLLWRVLTRLGVRAAWLAAALFLVHPVQVESVAWVTERKNVLSLALALAATLAWLDFRERSGLRRALAWSLATALLLAALAAKTVAAAAPAAWLVLLWAREGRPRRRDVLPLVPWIALGAAAGALTSWVERTYVFKGVFSLGLTAAERPLLAGRALAHYARTLVAPTDLVFCPPRFALDAGDPQQWAPLAIAAGLLLTAFALRRRVGRWPFAGALVYVIALAPALGFADVYPMIYSYVADHFQYHATTAGLALLATALATALRPAPAAARGLAIAAILLALAWQTSGMIDAYRDEETLWRETLDRNPEAIVAHNNLATLAHRRGDDGAALALLLEAAEVDAARTHPYVRATTLHNVGWSLIENGRPRESTAWFRRAIETHPAYYDAYAMLATRLAAEGRRDDAIDVLERVLALRPDFERARAQLRHLQGG